MDPFIRMAPLGQRHDRRPVSDQPVRRARIDNVLPSMRLNGETRRRRREGLIRRGWNHAEKAAPPFSSSVDHNNKSIFRVGHPPPPRPPPPLPPPRGQAPRSAPAPPRGGGGRARRG